MKKFLAIFLSVIMLGMTCIAGFAANEEADKPFEALIKLINEVQAVAGYDEELVAFIDSYMFAALQNSAEISKMITVSEFKQGEVNLKVKSLNGVALIPVVSERMKTAYDFGAESGFKPAANTSETYMLVCPKSAAHLVKKTENMRIFTPEQNIDADAYKFDYRIYYDVFVKKSGLDTVWAWVSPKISVTSVSEDVETVEGGIDETLTVNATSEGALTYQWYKCENTAGTYYYFARITVDGTASTDSDVITVTVA